MIAPFLASSYLSCPVQLGSDNTDWKSTVDLHIDELRDYFPWESLKGTVVDIGGGSGHISIALARVGSPFPSSDRV